MDTTSVQKLLTHMGLDATIRTYPDKSFDSVTQITTLGDPVDYSHKVVPPYKNREGYSGQEMITAGVGLTGIANKDLEFTVAVGIEIIIDGKTWTVTGFTPIINHTGVLFYTLEIDAGN